MQDFIHLSFAPHARINLYLILTKKQAGRFSSCMKAHTLFTLALAALTLAPAGHALTIQLGNDRETPRERRERRDRDAREREYRERRRHHDQRHIKRDEHPDILRALDLRPREQRR